MQAKQEKFVVDSTKTIISSQSETKKTAEFVAQTKYLLDIDFFISKIAGVLTKNFDTLFSNNRPSNENAAFKVQTKNREFSFLVKFGFQFPNQEEKDVIFYRLLNQKEDIKQNDLRVRKFLKSNENFEILIEETIDMFQKQKFQKLYRLSNVSNINFPVLSPDQLKISSIDNSNVIVQGVAGSGKTNVCIEKLVWVASKNYGGKVLYTTFSRGLLNETKLKVEAFKNNLKSFLEDFGNGKIEFLDDDRKKAIEKHLGIFFFVEEDDIPKKISRTISFFENQLDYFLIEDLYHKHFGEKIFANEDLFMLYLENLKNYQLANKLSKIRHISKELIFKEVFGLIFGFITDDVSKIMSEEKYIELRKNSFERNECETIYQIAEDYKEFIKSKNLTDNNFACREMLKNLARMPHYSLAVVDEVQDFSQINLLLLKTISLKMFCAGDVSQMINPAYFSFSFLKNLLFKDETTSVSELTNNYRNTNQIQNIVENLLMLNYEKLGIHSFVTKGQSVDTKLSSVSILCRDKNFINLLSRNKYDNFTIVVATKHQKQTLKKILQNQEILTIAEIKGLERDTILLYNIVSDNDEKWRLFESTYQNKKEADENSIYRYYFNLLYVGITRAKQNLFVIEDKNIITFSKFFQENFNCQSAQETINSLAKIISKIEYTQSEYLNRIEEFLNREQYDNARLNAEKLTDDIEKENALFKISVYENYVSKNQNREAGIRFWERGMLDEAKKQFLLSKDKVLIDLIDAISQNDSQKLDYQIVKYLPDVIENETAKEMIFDILEKDIITEKFLQKEINKKLKGARHGK